MNNLENSKVFIMVDSNNIYTPYNLVPAHDYQENALNDYIDNHIDGKKKYFPNCDIIFYIDKFDNTSLEGDYSDFYNFIREDGTITTISRNKDKLTNFCGYINRLTSL